MTAVSSLIRRLGPFVRGVGFLVDLKTGEVVAVTLESYCRATMEPDFSARWHFQINWQDAQRLAIEIRAGR